MNRETIQSVSMQELGPLIQERLDAGQSVRFSPMGVSMLPMLRQGQDSVVLSPLPQLLRKYDIVLYRRRDGRYVLHRIVRIGETYTCLGDNQFVPELQICREQMIGIVSGFHRGDQFHNVDELGYKLYCRLWYHGRYLRHFLYRVNAWLRRHCK